MAQTVKNLPAMQETWVQTLGLEDPLEKGMATHSSILAWRISWTEEPGRLQSMGSQKVGHDLLTNTSTSIPVPTQNGLDSTFTLASAKNSSINSILILIFISAIY